MDCAKSCGVCRVKIVKSGCIAVDMQVTIVQIAASKWKVNKSCQFGKVDLIVNLNSLEALNFLFCSLDMTLWMPMYCYKMISLC